MDIKKFFEKVNPLDVFAYIWLGIARIGFLVGSLIGFSVLFSPAIYTVYYLIWVFEFPVNRNVALTISVGGAELILLTFFIFGYLLDFFHDITKWSKQKIEQ